MSTPALDEFLISDDATGPAPAGPGERQPPATGHGPAPDGATPDAPEPPPDPGRWAMLGWRCGSWKAGPALTREQTAAAINTLLGRSAHLGPCASCHTPHRRYGAGGNPLCPTCRDAPPIP